MGSILDMGPVKMGTLRQIQCLLLGTVFIMFLLIVYWDEVRGGTFYLHMASAISASPPFSMNMMSTGHRTSEDRRYSFIWNTEVSTSKVLKKVPEMNSSPDWPKESSRSIKQNQTENSNEENQESHNQMLFDSHSQSSLLDLQLRQAERRHILRELCLANSSLNIPEKFKTFDQIPIQALDHLIVDDRHGVIYCYVPKVACTNWKRVMMVLSQSVMTPEGIPYQHPLDIPSYLSHNDTLHLTFSKFWRRFGRVSRRLMHRKLKNYKKFLFVRDPFVRLISAFRNKFGQLNEYFYTQFGYAILQRYANVSTPPNSAQEAFAAGIRPSFANFVKYLLDPQSEKKEAFNEHWQQIYRLCHPCQIEYDFVGKLETLDEDAEHLLKILGMDNQIHFPPGYHIKTTANWEQDWFENISLADRRALYNLYEPDFRLFGYDKPKTLLQE